MNKRKIYKTLALIIIAIIILSLGANAKAEGNTTPTPTPTPTATQASTPTASPTPTTAAVAVPSISLSAYNSFEYSAQNVAAYYVSVTATAPTPGPAQTEFALNKWTKATSTGTLTLEEGKTYYVWAEDVAETTGHVVQTKQA